MDVSTESMGCTIIQNWFPVAYTIIKIFTSTQKKYCLLEKESTAILFTCQRLDQYICGRKEKTHSTSYYITKKQSALHGKDFT